MSAVPDRAISLWQPWASLICPVADREPVKTIETRSWPTKYRGDILICSASRLPDRDAVYDIAGPLGWPERPFLRLGGALGVATIVDCLPIVAHPRECPPDWTGPQLVRETADVLSYSCGDYQDDIGSLDDQLSYGDFTPGRFGWILDNIRSFAEPIPVKGGQRLWRTDHPRNPNLRRQIAEALS